MRGTRQVYILETSHTIVDRLLVKKDGKNELIHLYEEPFYIKWGS